VAWHTESAPTNLGDPRFVEPLTERARRALKK